MSRLSVVTPLVTVFAHKDFTASSEAVTFSLSSSPFLWLSLESAEWRVHENAYLEARVFPLHLDFHLFHQISLQLIFKRAERVHFPNSWPRPCSMRANKMAFGDRFRYHCKTLTVYSLTLHSALYNSDRVIEICWYSHDTHPQPETGLS